MLSTLLLVRSARERAAAVAADVSSNNIMSGSALPPKKRPASSFCCPDDVVTTPDSITAALSRAPAVALRALHLLPPPPAPAPPTTTTTTATPLKRKQPSAAFCVGLLGAGSNKRLKPGNPIVIKKGLPPRTAAAPPSVPAPSSTKKAKPSSNGKKDASSSHDDARKLARLLLRRAIEAKADARSTDAHFAERQRQDAAAAAAADKRTPEQRALDQRAAHDLYERIRNDTPLPSLYLRRAPDRNGRPWFRRAARFAHLHPDTKPQFDSEHTLIYVTCADDHEAPTFASLKDLKRRSICRLTELPYACRFGADLVFLESDESKNKRAALYGEAAAARRYYTPLTKDNDSNTEHEIPSGHLAIPRKGVFVPYWPLEGANIHAYRAFTREFNRDRDTPLDTNARAALAFDCSTTAAAPTVAAAAPTVAPAHPEK